MDSDGLAIAGSSESAQRQDEPRRDATNLHEQAFSAFTRLLLWIVAPCIAIALSIASPAMAILLPFLLLPTLGLVWYNNAQPSKRKTDVETLIRTYIVTGTLGTAAVIVLQGIMSYAVAMLLFQSGTDRFLGEMGKQEADIAEMDAESLATRRDMAGAWQYWVFMLFVAFAVAGLVEEVLKYSALVYARRYGRIVHEYNYVVLAVAGALGFSTIENIGFVYAATQAKQGPGELALTLVERVVVGSPGHVTGAVLIGINAALRDFHSQPLGLMQIIGISVLFHGAFDFTLFSISALNGNVGWVHPHGKTLVLVLVFVIAIQATQAAVVRRAYTGYKVAMDRSRPKSR